MRLIALQFVFILWCLFANGQDFKGDTLIYENHRLLPGDTIHLGFGSGENKRFLFVQFRLNTILGGTPVDHRYSNAFIIYEGVKQKKALGKKYFDPLYFVNGTKYGVFIDLKNAVGSNEVKGFGLKSKS
jgi:hypothetical protein